MKTLELLGSMARNAIFNVQKESIITNVITEYVSWTEMTLTPDEDITIKLNDGDNVFMHFMYNLKDSISLSTASHKSDKELSAFQSAIIHQKQGLDTFMNFKKDGVYKLCVIQFAKFNEDREVNDFFLQFEEVFKAMSHSYYFMHTGIPNLQLGEYIKQLMEIPKNTLSEKLMAAGYINIVLSMKLRQYLEFINNPLPQSTLTVSEIQRLREITKLIHTNPEANYNIEDLCREWGLSANKLQTGFKEMHGKTVCNFVNHIRLIKAEELLKTTDLNVSEIVYSLGWSSRSYFCKIFKEKYLCTPKNYQLLLTNAS